MLLCTQTARAFPINLVSRTAETASAPDATDALDAQHCAWLKEIAAGSEQAFSSLYDSTASKVYGLALRITGQPALAEEAVSETYAQVWRQADRHDASRGRVLTWMLMISRSRSLDALRREQEADDIDDHDVEDAATGPDALIEYTNTQVILQRALLQLDSQQRQLLTLAFFRGMTHSELAEYTAMPLGTVKTVMRKGLEQLRQLLGPSLGRSGAG
ncbi:MAG: sigma-70 family RNA polymerase sigma factor [Pseudomonadota bacterium]